MVTAAKVKRAPPDTEVLLPGNLSALTEASIYARAAGYVRKRYVDIGDHVREGQLMAEIEAPELDQQVAQARAAVSQAQQQLGQTGRAGAGAVAARSGEGDGGPLQQSGGTRRGGAAGCRYPAGELTRRPMRWSPRRKRTCGPARRTCKQSQANLERVIALQEYKNVRRRSPAWSRRATSMPAR